MMSFATVDLGEPDSTEVGAWINANIRPAELFPLAYRAWPGYTQNGPLLNTIPEEPRSVQISSLFWPWGASRFARGHFVVTSAQLDAIRKKVFKFGAAVTGQFIFADGENDIRTNLWMLPATPLSQAANGLGLYLLTLVDDRYWWWGQPVDFSVDVPDSTWAGLYAAIGSTLEIDIAVAPISSAYGKPTIDYTMRAMPVPPVLDAVAFSVGQRIVRSLDGSVSSQSYTTATASLTSNLSAAWTPYAGGAFDFNPRG